MLMTKAPSIVERACELARTGKKTSEIRSKLRQEGYVHSDIAAHFNGRSLALTLRRLAAERQAALQSGSEPSE
jgi:hypothetical protein